MGYKRAIRAALGSAALGAVLLHGAARAQDAAPTAAAVEAQAKYTAVTPSQPNPALTVHDISGSSAHVLPTVSVHPAAVSATDSGPLLYNGGPVMTSVTIYTIFWAPATLQSGAAANMTPNYRTVLTRLAEDYVGHALDNNNTQYYQTVASKTTYISGLPASLAPAGTDAAPMIIDTDPYPASACTDTVTPGNCISDAQLQAEITSVMAARGWSGGLDRIYVVYTAQGEGSCFTGSTQCAYTYYCAYHGYFTIGSTPVVYANIPWGDTNYCQTSGTPSPNNDAPADTAATAAAHEITEAITDPELDAWYTAQGNEIADLCAYDYGTNRFDGGKANQFWNGHYYEIQTVFDNVTGACAQIGP